MSTIYSIGSKIPDFELSVYHNDKIEHTKLSKLRGKWIVLMFYPGDFTFVCPTELEEIAENYDKIKELNAEVVAISMDSVYVHKAWHDSSAAVKKVKFMMASDTEGKICRGFGLMPEGRKGPHRGTFIISPTGELWAYEVSNDRMGRSVDELIRKLQVASYLESHPDEACPAGWKPGQKTLKPGLDLVGKI